MIRTFSALLFFAAVGADREALHPAPRIWMRSHSIEWSANIADDIVIVSATRVIPIADLNEYHSSQEIHCKKEEGLRGSSAEEWTFRHDLSKTGKDDLGIVEGQKLLLFLVREPWRNDQNPIFWVNLSKPDVATSAHAAYDNDSNHLSDPRKILEIVRSRLTGDAAKRAPRKRGLIVGFKYGNSGMYWDFVRTADPEIKPRLIKDLSAPHDSTRSDAIYNLISYPGAETVEAIRPLLKDPATRDLTRENKTVQQYHVRQAAYLALTFLGEKVDKPEPYYDQPEPFLFEVGFEQRSYFPYGDWKRLKE
jgi:hypothetical protein